MRTWFWGPKVSLPQGDTATHQIIHSVLGAVLSRVALFVVIARIFSSFKSVKAPTTGNVTVLLSRLRDSVVLSPSGIALTG